MEVATAKRTLEGLRDGSCSGKVDMAKIECYISHIDGTDFKKYLGVNVYDGRKSKRFFGLSELCGNVLIQQDYDLPMFLLAIRSVFGGHLTSDELRDLQATASELWLQEFGLSELNLNQR